MEVAEGQDREEKEGEEDNRKGEEGRRAGEETPLGGNESDPEEFGLRRWAKPALFLRRLDSSVKVGEILWPVW